MQENRTSLLQKLIDKFNYKNYLEIGVFKGSNFFPIKAARKIAVDPFFKLNKRRKFYFDLINSSNRKAAYYAIPSDDFFAQKGNELLGKDGLDLCFIDGMHEYKYVLNDILNSLNHLQPNGMILLHDCNPLTKEANVSFKEWEERGFSGMWNGDVWKSIVHLRATRPDLYVAVIDCDHGLGVVKFGQPDSMIAGMENADFENLTYEEFEQNRANWINLISVDAFKNKFGLQ